MFSSLFLPSARIRPRTTLPLIASAIVLAAACQSHDTDSSEREAQTREANAEVPEQPTFHRDVAPILNEHCVSCHRPNAFAPFALVSHDDAQRRAKLIATVTRERRMPPWLPSASDGSVPVFRGARHLSSRDLEVLDRWATTGGLPGDPADAPPTPEYSTGWQLGEPDLILTMEEFTLAAEGGDEIRNFVLPRAPLEGRYVSAIEFLPQNPRVIHHANVLADTTGQARLLDQRDPDPGYRGMVAAIAPGGHFMGWTAGRTARPFEEGTAWQVEAGTDLVVQLHLFPSGRTEEVQPSVGLWFTDDPPERQPASVHLGTTAIDLAAGEEAYELTDSWTLPFDVQAVAIYPHQHYLGRAVKVTATAPEGTPEPTVRTLLEITDWSFDWQDEYAWTESVTLRAGTRLEARFVWDNSASNPQNPHDPPQAVRWGPGSLDEMGDVWIEVLPLDSRDLVPLRAAIWRRDLELSLAAFEIARVKRPGDWLPHARSAQVLLSLERFEDALAPLHQALARGPDDPWHLHYNLGLALSGSGRYEEATLAFRQATRGQPSYAPAWGNLANCQLQLGALDEAAQFWQRALELDPKDPTHRTNLAVLEAKRGHEQRAEALYLEVLAEHPRSSRAHGNLATLLAKRGDLGRATAHLEEALTIDPTYVEAHKNLATIAVGRGDLPGAIARLEKAIEIAPHDDGALALLGLAYSQSGDLGRARTTLVRGLEVAPRNGGLHWTLADVLALEQRHGEAVEHYRAASELLEPNPDLAWSTAQALTRAGRNREALAAVGRAAALGHPEAERLLAGTQ